MTSPPRSQSAPPMPLLFMSSRSTPHEPTGQTSTTPSESISISPGSQLAPAPDTTRNPELLLLTSQIALSPADVWIQSILDSGMTSVTQVRLHSPSTSPGLL